MAPQRKVLFHALIVTHNVEIPGCKSKQAKYIKISRLLDKIIDEFPGLKSWIVLAPGVFMSEGRTTINAIRKIKSLIKEKLGVELEVYAIKAITDLAKELEVEEKMRKSEFEELQATWYETEVREFGGAFYIPLPKQIARSLGVGKGSKIIVHVARKPG